MDLLELTRHWAADADADVWKRLNQDPNWFDSSTHLGETIQVGPSDRPMHIAQSTQLFTRMEWSTVVGIAVATTDLRATIIPRDTPGWEELATAIVKAEAKDWRTHASIVNRLARRFAR